MQFLDLFRPKKFRTSGDPGGRKEENGSGEEEGEGRREGGREPRKMEGMEGGR